LTKTGADPEGTIALQ